MSIILYNNKTNKLDFFKEDNVMSKLYYLEASVPTKKNIELYLNSKKTNIKIKMFFKNENLSKKIEDIINKISLIDNMIPLYNQYNKNLYLIDRNLVYNRVMKQFYRFPNEILRNRFIEKKIELSKIKNRSMDIVHKRNIRKLELMINFLKNFNLKILYNVYKSIIYDESVGKELSICKRASYIPYLKHIIPYYTKVELLNLGLNLEIIKEKDI